MPGLAAKPIIDMMADVDDLDELIEPIIQAGCQYPRPTTLCWTNAAGPAGHPPRSGPTTCTSSPTQTNSAATSASGTSCEDICLTARDTTHASARSSTMPTVSSLPNRPNSPPTEPN